MWLSLVLWAAGLVFCLGVVIWAARDRRGGAGGRVGNALQPWTSVDISHLLNLQAIYEPGKKHLLEKQQAEEREQDDEGEPPETGSR